MSLSIRHSIQWLETEPQESESTSTIVITSPLGKYVDIRKLKNIQNFSNQFDWFFAGYEIEHSSTIIEFNHEFLDSKLITHYLMHNGNTENFKIESDIGHFSDPIDENERNAGIRLETGKMINPLTNQLEKYQEKWITVDSTLGPQCKFIGNKLIDNNCIVLDTVSNIDIGRIILLNSWIQGIFWRKNIISNEIVDNVGVLRCFKDENLIEFGKFIDYLPHYEQLLKIGKNLNIYDTCMINNVEWKVVEKCGEFNI